MVLKNGERSLLLEELSDAKPYMAETESVDELVRRLLQLADSIDDYMKRIQKAHDSSQDPVLRTDLRIYMGRIQRRVRNHSV